MSEKFAVSERTKIKRIPKRGAYDRAAVYSILDEALVCHMAFVADGKPVTIPTLHARIDNELVVHGSAASRMMRELSKGIDVAISVAIVDGLVLARSAFHHSVNYRSVVVFGRARLVETEDAKMEALRAFTEHVVPGRWAEIRPPNAKELKGTTVLSLPLEEVSAKMRTGDPIDDDEDHLLDVWAGILPLDLVPGKPVDDGKLRSGIAVPANIAGYSRKK